MPNFERVEEGEVHEDWGHPPQDHDCKQFAMHGILNERYYHAPIEDCMKCGRWRSPRLQINDWQPKETLNEFIRKYRERTGR